MKITRVIHIRESKKTDDEVYIGRPGKGLDGYFGNPIRKGSTCYLCGKVHTAGASTLPCYKAYLKLRIGNDPAFKARVKELHGKTLVCFCKPNACHGDYLARVSACLQCEE